MKVSLRADLCIEADIADISHIRSRSRYIETQPSTIESCVTADLCPSLSFNKRNMMASETSEQWARGDNQGDVRIGEPGLANPTLYDFTSLTPGSQLVCVVCLLQSPLSSCCRCHLALEDFESQLFQERTNLSAGCVKAPNENRDGPTSPRLAR